MNHNFCYISAKFLMSNWGRLEFDFISTLSMRQTGTEKSKQLNTHNGATYSIAAAIWIGFLNVFTYSVFTFHIHNSCMQIADDSHQLIHTNIIRINNNKIINGDDDTKFDGISKLHLFSCCRYGDSWEASRHRLIYLSLQTQELRRGCAIDVLIAGSRQPQNSHANLQYQLIQLGPLIVASFKW